LIQADESCASVPLALEKSARGTEVAPEIAIATGQDNRDALELEILFLNLLSVEIVFVL
jgi:hypothetical protein